MSVTREESILKFVVDQDGALAELDKTKKSIIQVKEEQKQLNDAYKKGSITIDEYAQDSVRLEGILKKNQSQYNNIQKSVTGVKTQLDKLIDSNKKISKSFEDTANNINVAGVNIESLTTRLASFANPATAAVGIAAALGAAYARSTIGAKDLAFAQNQLSQATTLITNRFAGLISSAEDGEGFFTKFGNSLASFIGNTAALPLKVFGILDVDEILAKSKELATIAEELEDRQREEVQLRIEANGRLSDNQDLLTDIQSDQTKYNDKLDKANEIITNIKRNEETIKANLESQLAIANKQVSSDEAKESLQDARNKISKEISAVEKDSAKRVAAVERLQQNITEQNEKQLKTERDKSREIQKNLNNLKRLGEEGPLDLKSQGPQAGSTGFKKEESSVIKEGTLAIVDSAKVAERALAEIQSSITRNAEKESGKRTDIDKGEYKAKLAIASDAAIALSGIFDQGTALQKAFALIGIGIDTAEAIAAATAASEENPANAVTYGAAGAAQFAASLVRILANIATAKSYIGFAEGGYTGSGFGRPDSSGYKPAGIVHENEYVSPSWVVNSSAARPHLQSLESMRLRGYADGGLVTNSITSETNQSILMANAMKNLPPAEVSVKEVTRVQNRVRIKEHTVKAKGRAFKS